MHDSFSQSKQEEKEWLKVYQNLFTREIPDKYEAHVSDANTLDSFVQKYPNNGVALYFLKSEIFNLLFWKGNYDSSYSEKYVDVLTWYINLPDEVDNGCRDRKICKTGALINRSQMYLLMHDTLSACDDYLRVYNYLQADTGTEARKMKSTPGLLEQINKCWLYH